MDFYHKLCEINEEENVLQDELMKNHTTFRVGGPAKYFVTPKTIEAIKETIRCCKENRVSYYILGNGSNLLVSDEGFEGVVIQIYQNLNEISIEGTDVRAQAGAMLVRVANQAAKEALTGLEFASGIPGTIGGAMIMNAGAYGGEMKDVAKEITVLTNAGEIQTLQRDEMDLGYRSSRMAKEESVVLEAVLELSTGNLDEIKEKIVTLKEARTSKQPLEYPSAGSTFKRPKDNFAGKLIMEAGLRGFSVGGAQVSEKHCGFVVNKGGATAQDVIDLTNYIREKIKKETGITLELEIKQLGF